MGLEDLRLAAHTIPASVADAEKEEVVLTVDAVEPVAASEEALEAASEEVPEAVSEEVPETAPKEDPKTVPEEVTVVALEASDARGAVSVKVTGQGDSVPAVETDSVEIVEVAEKEEVISEAEGEARSRTNDRRGRYTFRGGGRYQNVKVNPERTIYGFSFFPSYLRS